jgi:hypothetical protein
MPWAMKRPLCTLWLRPGVRPGATGRWCTCALQRPPETDREVAFKFPDITPLYLWALRREVKAMAGGKGHADTRGSQCIQVEHSFLLCLNSPDP